MRILAYIIMVLMLVPLVAPAQAHMSVPMHATQHSAHDTSMHAKHDCCSQAEGVTVATHASGHSSTSSCDGNCLDCSQVCHIPLSLMTMFTALLWPAAHNAQFAALQQGPHSIPQAFYKPPLRLL